MTLGLLKNNQNYLLQIDCKKIPHNKIVINVIIDNSIIFIFTNIFFFLCYCIFVIIILNKLKKGKRFIKIRKLIIKKGFINNI